MCTHVLRTDLPNIFDANKCTIILSVSYTYIKSEHRETAYLSNGVGITQFTWIICIYVYIIY